MPATRPSLADDPDDSAFSQELPEGQANLRFDAAPEAAYRIGHLQRVRRRVRIWNSASIVLAVALAADPVRPGNTWNMLSVALAAVLIPCGLALVWLPWSRHYERLYLPIGRFLVTITQALLTVVVVLALLARKVDPSASLAVILSGVFFFSGLMPRQALSAAVAVLMVFALSELAVGIPFAWFLESMVTVTVMAGFAAVAHRSLDQSHRRNFLQAALIGRLSAHDCLSGLMNRRAFDEHLARMWKQAFRDQRPVAVLMIDIDDLDEYIDQCGHVAGDFARRSVAKLIQDVARRPLDFAASNGSREFIVFLYDLESTHAQYMAERLREAVQNLAHAAERWTGPEITVSVGVGFAAPNVGCPADGAVQLAAEALSGARQAGRNCIVVRGADTYAFRSTGVFSRLSQARPRPGQAC
jgi:diguanylate cyclase (GGDEF)-like protein